MAVVLYLLWLASSSTYILQCDCCLDFTTVECCSYYLCEFVCLVHCGFICYNWTKFVIT